jgi:hypothetical protein
VPCLRAYPLSGRGPDRQAADHSGIDGDGVKKASAENGAGGGGGETRLEIEVAGWGGGEAQLEIIRGCGVKEGHSWK